jgi:prepilin-type N-terminal cleavage/methylation domain-containing protein
MKYQSTPNGFSLIELMIVVAIVAILAAVAVPAYFNHVLRSRQADAYHNLLDMKAAQEMFLSMENTYAGPYWPTLPTSGDTFTRLLSFNYADTTYYVYGVTNVTSSSFEAQAKGKFKKLSGDVIRIRDDEDPCVEAHGALEMSLNLEDCP